MKQKRLFRSEKDKVIAGVCGGLAVYFDIDPSILRLIFLLGLIFGFSTSFWIYIVLWIILPTESQVKEQGSEVIRKNVEEMKEKAEGFVEDVKKAVKPKKSE